jgi:hypothetical protein
MASPASNGKPFSRPATKKIKNQWCGRTLTSGMTAAAHALSLSLPYLFHPHLFLKHATSPLSLPPFLQRHHLCTAAHGAGPWRGAGRRRHGATTAWGRHGVGRRCHVAESGAGWQQRGAVVAAWEHDGACSSLPQ